MFMSAYEFLQEILNADMQADFFLQMIYFDFADSFLGFNVYVTMFLQNTLSTNVKADFFLQMIYFDFAERF